MKTSNEQLGLWAKVQCLWDNNSHIVAKDYCACQLAHPLIYLKYHKNKLFKVIFIWEDMGQS